MLYRYRKLKVKDIKHTWPIKEVDDYKDVNYPWDKLKSSILEGGYNPEEHKYISVTLDNIIIDGHHRKEVLTEIYGGEYTIIVKKNIFPFLLTILPPTVLYIIFRPFVYIYEKIKGNTP